MALEFRTRKTIKDTDHTNDKVCEKQKIFTTKARRHKGFVRFEFGDFVTSW
jgi:hypothetical protein